MLVSRTILYSQKIWLGINFGNLATLATAEVKSAYLYTVKRHFYACEKLMRISQNGPPDKFM